jgi:large subunit ribosomal protein L10
MKKNKLPKLGRYNTNKELKMATKQFKTDKIDALKSKLEKAKVAVVTEYKGFSVEEITKLRRELQKTEADLTVTKNTLCKVASQGTNFEAIAELMTGPTAIAFGYGDEVAAAKSKEIMEI